jgi:hypothetical protein
MSEDFASEIAFEGYSPAVRLLGLDAGLSMVGALGESMGSYTSIVGALGLDTESSIMKSLGLGTGSSDTYTSMVGALGESMGSYTSIVGALGLDTESSIMKSLGLGTGSSDTYTSMVGALGESMGSYTSIVGALGRDGVNGLADAASSVTKFSSVMSPWSGNEISGILAEIARLPQINFEASGIPISAPPQVEPATMPEGLTEPAKKILNNRAQQDLVILLVGVASLYFLCSKIPKFGDDIKSFIEFCVFVDLCIKYIRKPPSE